ncbi:MAG: hypothetical protein QOI10_985 [Solirubrobacterales bacterium]|jgi:hypothetical protein|nr:hypothetical protein [Solirubrobacterales bacterium]
MRARPVLALLALAGMSLVLWPAPPGYDAWIWLDWGRDLVHLTLHTDPGSTGVAWKPLPALLAAPLSLAGSAAPELWVLLVRFCALLSLLLAYKIGTRLADRFAGVVAVLALLLLPDYWGVVVRADAEPILVALALGAVELHLGGRRRAAFAAIFGVALIRPEVWPMLGLYALWLWRDDPRARPAVAAAVAAVPALWFGLDWLGSGNALTGPGTARGVARETSAADALGKAAEALPAPLWAFVAVAVFHGLNAPAATLRRRLAQPVLAITAIALAWLAAVVVLGALGYIGTERFVVAPACLLCPVIGAGATWALAPFEGRWRVAAAVALALLAIPLALRERDRIDARIGDLPALESDGLADLVAADGVRDAALACPGRIAIDDSRLLARLVYELDASANRVGSLLTLPQLPGSGGAEVIIARAGSVDERELTGMLGTGFSGIAGLASNERWSAYALSCPPGRSER